MQRPPHATPSQHLLAEAIARQPLLFALNLILIALVAAAMSGAVSTDRLNLWLGLALGLQTVRLAAWAALRRTPPEALGRAAAVAIVLVAVLLGVIWGAFALLFFEAGPIPYRLFVPFVVAGITAASIASFAGCLSATLAFLATCLAPYITLLALQDEPVYQTMAPIILLYGILLGLTGRHMQAVMLRMARLSTRNADLIVDLERARGDLERRVEARTDALRQTNLALSEEVEERRRSEARVRHLLMHDTLTDLPNRLLVFDRLAQALKSARRHGQRVAVMMLDLDDFKRVNDTLGHPAGDALLRALSGRLRAGLRASDTIGRLGGDEFAVLLPDVGDANAAAAIAAKLLDACARPLHVGGGVLVPSLSLGIALYPEHGLTPDDLLSGADLALYQAKAEGKGNYRVFSPAMRSVVLARDALEGELRQGLAKGQFCLVYQPRLALDTTRRTVAAEALLRWRHPERGFLPPAAFLPTAESGRVLRDIGRWVVARACADAVRWRAAGLDARVAVNLSMLELAQPDLVRTVEAALGDSGLAPAMLELEVGDGVCRGGDDAGADPVIAWLADLGIGVTIDDFGAGPVSLAHLRRLRLRGLKIDPAFVRGIADDPKDAATVEAIVRLGHALGLVVVGEGVERQEQLDALDRLGCDEAQGFLLAQPMPVEALIAFARARRPARAGGA